MSVYSQTHVNNLIGRLVEDGLLNNEEVAAYLNEVGIAYKEKFVAQVAVTTIHEVVVCEGAPQADPDDFDFKIKMMVQDLVKDGELTLSVDDLHMVNVLEKETVITVV